MLIQIIFFFLLGICVALSSFDYFFTSVPFFGTAVPDYVFKLFNQTLFPSSKAFHLVLDNEGHQMGNENIWRKYDMNTNNIIIYLVVLMGLFLTLVPSASALDLAAEANGPYTGTAGVAISFSGSSSGGTTPHTYSWDFGDGTPISTDQNPTHVYAADGSYTATLTVTDGSRPPVTATDTATVTVNPGPLVADAHGRFSCWRNRSVYL